ncbi:ABC transporter substrate-binding protein [Dehalobacter restrictus]|uniref:ABC transporter substrate-binding protein n=1 Tax=Dehalobacter restrictus TaxID=55583 RepID=A0A857DD96_9FIRM|nr:ABC transporter substrate-binding protein [Dehalobacter restrictus]QGZ99213.1 ABC transporter substrate-binding protein [Dehalobacter restrictus]
MKMKKTTFLALLLALSLLVLFSGCGNKAATQDQSGKSEKIVITDMAGRQVELEKAATKAYATNAIGQMYIYNINPAKLAGWTSALTEGQKKYILKEYQDLPALGHWAGATPTVNNEQLIKMNIDVIFSIVPLNDTQKSIADNITNTTGIPVIMLSYQMDDIPEVYTIIGKALGEEEQAAKLGAYCEKELQEVKSLAASIPEEKRASIYLAESDDGLTTDPSGKTTHTTVPDYLGLKNVADAVSVNAANGVAAGTTISLEQLLSWDPDYIIGDLSDLDSSYGKSLSERLCADPKWVGLTAVKEKHVFDAPIYPHNWIDRPASSIRVLGAKWLGNLIYPDVFKYDIREEAKEYFSLFYHIELTDDMLDEMLKYSQK